MNKKLGILLLALCSLAACGKDASEEVLYEEVLPSAQQNADQPDYTGVYEGFLPAASGPGIQTSITLNGDGSFVWRSEYIGEQDGVFTDKGMFTVTGNIAALEIPGEGVHYAQLEGGHLRLLDQDKAAITGALADMYVLGKVK